MPKECRLSGEGGKLRPIGYLHAVIFVVLAQALASCGEKTPTSNTGTTSPPADALVAAQTDPHWVHRSTSNAKIAVVFIHGIIGDLNETWTNADKKITFFDLLKQAPEVGSKVDIFAFGYPSRVLGGGSFTIGEAAKRIPNEFRQQHTQVPCGA